MESTKEKIVKYIKENGPVSAKDLVEYISISKQALFLHLKYLVENNYLSKIGTPPKVFYILNEERNDVKVNFSEDVKKIIDENFLFISATGRIKEGVDGFVFWCTSNNLDPIKTSKEYINTLKKYDKYRLKSGLIDGTQKIKDSFENNIFLNKVFYLDFYAIERFGKTKLGQLLLYSKQSQDKKLIKTLSLNIKDRILDLVKEYKIDAVCFTPPTVKRETQFMKELEKNLNLSLKKVKIIKIKSDIAVPQKTLNKLGDRIKNAESTFFINDKGFYGNILIIDDAIGSGATLNIIAKKIKQAKINKGKVIGLAITGSYKGFDVISEV